MINIEDITWAPIIPLIGGFPLGAELAIGKPPKFIASYSGFEGNDEHYVNYQTNTLGRDIEYINLTEQDNYTDKVNIVVCTPPCAALSQLNTGKSPEVKGSGCAKNEWMYQVVYDGAQRFDADVIIIENAPALFTNKGAGVAQRLEEIATELGRTISFYKTSTRYHGIPQARDRTFAFIWKLESAPILDWYKREFVEFSEYVKEVPEDALQQDIVVNPGLSREPFYNYIKHKTGNDNAREEIFKIGKKTAFQWIQEKELLEDAAKWFAEVEDDKGLRLAEHAINKISQGRGIWDSTVHIAHDTTQAWIGRNMNDTIHPTEERSCTIRESLHIMGFPHDFELIGGRRAANHIAQNVPTCTARDMVYEAMHALLGNRKSSGLTVFKQNNHNEIYITPPKENAIDLTNFF